MVLVHRKLIDNVPHQSGTTECWCSPVVVDEEDVSDMTEVLIEVEAHLRPTIH